MCAIFNTESGSHSIGTKAPHKKLEPNATTFTIPFIAPLFDTKFPIKNGELYQVEGSLNGVNGRFEWITQDGFVTHRMFVKNGKINGVPIKP